MGNYTILSVDLSLRPNLSGKTVTLLSYMVNGGSAPVGTELPSVPFFQCENWEQACQDRWMISRSDILLPRTLDQKESKFNSITHDITIRASGKSPTSTYLHLWDWLQTLTQTRLGTEGGWYYSEDDEDPISLVIGQCYASKLFNPAVNRVYNS